MAVLVEELGVGGGCPQGGRGGGGLNTFLFGGRHCGAV